MRQGTRVVCLFLPFLFLLASLICLLLVFLGDRSSSGASWNHRFYFIKFNTSKFEVDGHALSSVVSNLQDWYTISLWNYCSGPSTSTTPTFCSSPQFAFYFDPSQVWSLADLAISALSGIDWNHALATYRDVAKFVFIAYIIAIIATAITIVLSFFAFCSRIGSIFTTAMCGLSIFFTIAASATATAMYLVLAGVVKAQLGKYGVTVSMGGTMIAVTWLAAGFAIVGAGWYLFSSCCCGVDNTYKALRGQRAWRRGHHNRNSRVALVAAEDEFEKGYQRVDRTPSPNPYAKRYLSGVGYQQTPYTPVQGEHAYNNQGRGYAAHDNLIGVATANPAAHYQYHHHHQAGAEPYRSVLP